MLSKDTILKLNRECFCFPLDRAALDERMLQSVSAEVARRFDSRDNLFAGTGVMLHDNDVDAMLGVIDAIETLTRSARYRADKLPQLPERNTRDAIAGDGLIMGYDFHIGAHTPQLIEVNTNAGGAFIVGELLSASEQIYPACCGFAPLGLKTNLLPELLQREWQSAGREGTPQLAVIVDEDPESEFLLPDMLLAKDTFECAGTETLIAAISALEFSDGALRLNGRVVDIVYNRSTDFLLKAQHSVALRDAWLSDAAVVAPNPLHHCLYANKLNFIDFTDNEMLLRYGLTKAHRQLLASHVPATRLVTADNAADIYAQRRRLFFKPVDGYGGKSVYRGDKLTRRVWRDILDRTERGRQIIAQEIVAPPVRAVDTPVKLEERKPEQAKLEQPKREQLKFDVRIYTAGGEPLLAAARMYRGQTTNFRTAGGGFGPVYTWSNAASDQPPQSVIDACVS